MPRRAPLRFATPFGAYVTRRSEKLGEGGNGTVYRALEEGTGAAVAVKVLDPAKVTREKARRFKNEILFGQRARHSNVLPISDYGTVVLDGHDTSFYVMPLYATTLRGLLTAGVAPDRALALYAGLLDGVEAAHRDGVVHRDLKPENVLYDETRDALVVADFGIARFADGDLYTAVETRAGARVGNFQYAAPEQRTPGREVDERADIYALGLMLNELFTGAIPYGTNYPTVADTAPAYAVLDPLVASMLEQSPGARPASIDAVRQRLPSVAAADPLVRDPVRVVDTDTTVPHALVLVLNHAPTPKWKEVMQRMSVSGHYPEYDPRRMTISGNRVTIPVDRSHRVPLDGVARSYTEFIRAMAEAYPQALDREARQRESEARFEQQRRERADRQRREWKEALGI